ncbi:hypothetical protein W97_09297 [Coniosporium apollinis CBS 100218]|uniref:Glycosyl hydrolase family 13 catalytic domain-containing protein n=1 Tax=Coniosporium apollinis (strain CBS 100218) TaxID=1168221 RepID=R7Z7Q7_CONA1|nr:uncharacterized protein W97_09297 [Coniosporium apollinis CBS 100218]EON70059.1 hypothetical protein W97_09297 [Coniosporium apollinis CBS 100218]
MALSESGSFEAQIHQRFDEFERVTLSQMEDPFGYLDRLNDLFTKCHSTSAPEDRKLPIMRLLLQRYNEFGSKIRIPEHGETSPTVPTEGREDERFDVPVFTSKARQDQAILRGFVGDSDVVSRQAIMDESFILKRRHEKFLLWAPGRFSDMNPPLLVLGRLSPGDEPSFDRIFRGELKRADEKDIWELGCNDLRPFLENDCVYHYWFEIVDTSPDEHGTMLVTDPLAYNVDYRLKGEIGNQPAAVIKFRHGKLYPCDANGVEEPVDGNKVPVPDLSRLPNNNQLVIYELPASWARGSGEGIERDIGTFMDIVGLLEEVDDGSTGNHRNSKGTIIADLGINAIELLPAADAKPIGAWGYATAHYFATDNDLGTPKELTGLVRSCHKKNIRLFMDTVMGFGHDPYIHIAYYQFHLRPQREQDNADAWQSSRDGELRDRFGGESWRYVRATNTTNPITGISPAANERRFQYICPASAFHLLHLERWMSDFGIGGLRLDSANNIGNWNFIRRYKDEAWKRFASRYKAPRSHPQYQPEEDPDLRNKFLVIAEELAVPIDMIRSRCVNALWNEHFQRLIRAVIVGESYGGDNFEWTVRKMIDCRQISFRNGIEDRRFTSATEAVNYITSHDVQGWRKERLYNFLHNIGIHDNKGKELRTKLAFVCLLTAVGIPMIFAGEEFCDQHDKLIEHPSKQTDPVNYDRKTEEWRSRVFDYVKKLVKLRTKCPALGDEETDFFYWDFSNNRRVVAWKRGGRNDDPVVVVANFSDQHVPTRAEAMPNWPSTPNQKRWSEITQGGEIRQESIGREELSPWEAKVYTCWTEGGE